MLPQASVGTGLPHLQRTPGTSMASLACQLLRQQFLWPCQFTSSTEAICRPSQQHSCPLLPNPIQRRSFGTEQHQTQMAQELVHLSLHNLTVTLLCLMPALTTARLVTHTALCILQSVPSATSCQVNMLPDPQAMSASTHSAKTLRMTTQGAYSEITRHLSKVRHCPLLCMSCSRRTQLCCFLFCYLPCYSLA